LAAWYKRFPGISFNNNSYVDLPFTKTANHLQDIMYYLFLHPAAAISTQVKRQVMINLRVNDLFALLDQLKEEGIKIVGEPLDEEYGKFGWIMDPEGNKIELWQPQGK
jgi:hypothetical protein